jgi:hypothetical protein
MTYRHPYEAGALADLDADRAGWEAHEATRLDVGPLGPHRDRHDLAVVYGSLTRAAADAARATEARRRAHSDALPF